MRQDRLLEIVGRIYQRPETWEQRTNHCGSSHCVLGHAEIDAGHEIVNPFTHPRGVGESHQLTFRRGRKWLGLTYSQADWVFDPDRTLPELIHFATTGKCP